MDLMFRDQSKEVVRKVQRIKQKAKPKDSASVSAAPDCCQVFGKSVDSDIPLASECLYNCWSTLEVSAEQQAVCFFFSSYAMEPSKSGKSVYDYLPTFYNQESGKSPLSCATAALGLAGLSYRRNEPRLLSAANSTYSSALHLTNEALRNPVTAVTDATLISVLLLGLYETNTCTAPPSMRAWLKHISGATALLELRGKQQLDTEVGRRLFAYLCTQIVNFSILRRQPIPSAILRLLESYPAMSEGYRTDITKKFYAISARHCILRAKIASSPSGTLATCTESIISEALSIAADLQSWHSNLPPDYHPTSTVKIPGLTPDVFSDYYHIYSDVPTAMIMNNYRVLLILLHEIIVAQSNHVRSSPIDVNERNGFNYAPPPSYIAQIQGQVKRSQDVIFDLIEQVCASVPFLLDYEYCVRARDTLSKPDHPWAAGGNAIMWPLYVCAQVNFVPNSTRAWIIGRLNKIGAELGVQQAKVMAKILLQRTEVTEVLAEDNELDDEYAATEERGAVLTDRICRGPSHVRLNKVRRTAKRHRRVQAHIWRDAKGRHDGAAANQAHERTLYMDNFASSGVRGGNEEAEPEAVADKRMRQYLGEGAKRGFRAAGALADLHAQLAPYNLVTGQVKELAIRRRNLAHLVGKVGKGKEQGDAEMQPSQ